MAATGLRSKEKYGTTGAEDLRNIPKDHLEDHSGVTNTDVTSSLVLQSLPQHSVEEGRKTADFFARSHSNVGKQPRTAQLTLFYAGMVNVYDDVPIEKAEAIMVLAGRARTFGASAKDTGNVLSGSCATDCDAPASIAMKQPVSRAQSPSQLTTKPESGPNVQRPKTLATRVELPQARKASLARFLERRKDRFKFHLYHKFVGVLKFFILNCKKQSWILSKLQSGLGFCFADHAQDLTPQQCDRIALHPTLHGCLPKTRLLCHLHPDGINGECTFADKFLWWLIKFPVVVFDTSFPEENKSIVVNTFR